MILYALADQVLHLRDAGRRIGRVVGEREVDLLAVDLAVPPVAYWTPYRRPSTYSAP